MCTRTSLKLRVLMGFAFRSTFCEECTVYMGRDGPWIVVLPCLAGLLAVSVLLVTAFVLWYRNNRFITASSPLFLYMILFGRMCICMTLSLWMCGVIADVTRPILNGG